MNLNDLHRRLLQDVLESTITAGGAAPPHSQRNSRQASRPNVAA